MATLRKFDLPYSGKNIPIPAVDTCQKKLIEMVESVIRRMRWKAFFFLRRGDEHNIENDADAQGEKYGLKSRKCPPQIDEMKAFEAAMFNLIGSLEFREVKDDFQKKMRTDIAKIRKSNEVFLPSDKTRNLYAMDKDQYGRLLQENITKNYTHAPEAAYDNINGEAQVIATDLKIADRVDVLARRESFITLKDHKDNFRIKVPCRLINPAEGELGLVSKHVLDKINATLRQKLNVQQWKSTADVVSWFEAIKQKSACVFTTFDICEFYPSISEKLLTDALNFARHFTEISVEEERVIMHARKSLLFNGDKEWVKKNKAGLFDITMGSFDRAEICELVGTYALASLPEDRYCKKEIGLYMDDGLMVHRGTTRSEAERIKKDLTKRFSDLGLKITISTNLLATDFLDLTLNLPSGTYQPYRKPNDVPTYVHRQSNHPPSILKNIPAAVSRRITDTSSDQRTFNTAAPLYNNALKASGYGEHISFLSERKEGTATAKNPKRNRTRCVIWFNPPYSKSVKTRVGHRFLQLVRKHFPKVSALHKIFNGNTIKVSYSCLPNVASIIKAHNSSVLRSPATPPAEHPSRTCNCRQPDACPLAGNCLTSSVVYRATVHVSNSNPADDMYYIGLTERTFKERHTSHMSNFRLEKYAGATELSKYVWDLKKKGKNYEVKWEVLGRAPAYSSTSKRCQLCTTEKLFTATANQKNLLNKSSELISTCRHRRKFLLAQFCSTEHPS